MIIRFIWIDYFTQTCCCGCCCCQWSCELFGVEPLSTELRFDASVDEADDVDDDDDDNELDDAVVVIAEKIQKN